MAEGSDTDAATAAAIAAAIEEVEREALMADMLALAAEMRRGQQRARRDGTAAGGGDGVARGQISDEATAATTAEPRAGMVAGLQFPAGATAPASRHRRRRPRPQPHCATRCEECCFSATHNRVTTGLYLASVAVIIADAVFRPAQHALLFVGMGLFLLTTGFALVHQGLRLRREWHAERGRARELSALFNRPVIRVDAATLDLMTRDLGPEDYERLLQLDAAGHRGRQAGLSRSELELIPVRQVGSSAPAPTSKSASSTLSPRATMADLPSARDKGKVLTGHVAVAVASAAPVSDTTALTSDVGDCDSGRKSREGAARPAGAVHASPPDDTGTCAVCLDDFATGDSLRQLPCSHSFHPHCIDPWLATSVTCPVCKASVRQALGLE